jgi:hypothetical protein
MNMLHPLTVIVSAGIVIVQCFALWGVPYHLGGTAKSVLALLSSVIIAYINDGYLRDAYR